MNAPYIVAWELTKACNLECLHCRASSTFLRDSRELSTSQGKNLLEELSSFGTKMIILSGGEALVRDDALELARFGSSLGLRMTLATNGSSVTRQLAEQIRDSGIVRVSVSIDGVTADMHDRFRGRPGAFELALSGVENLRLSGVGVQINTTIAAMNIEQTPLFPEFIKNLGATAWHVFFLVPTGRGHQLESASIGEYRSMLGLFLDAYKSGLIECKATCAPQFYRMLEESGINAGTKGCLAGTGFGFVSSTGDVQPCGFLDKKCGNINDKPFSKIWLESKTLIELRNPGLLKGKCSDCRFKLVCAGCRARAFEVTGDMNETDPVCWYKNG